MTNTQVIKITADNFDRLRELADYEGGLKANQSYDVYDPKWDMTHFGYSPNGIGCYWYDNPIQRSEDVG